MENPDPVLAWLVEHEGHAVVVFAVTQRAAASVASHELNVDMKKLVDIPKRIPALDSEAPGPVSSHLLIHDYGWTICCHTCGTGITKHDTTAICTGDIAFCDDQCANKYLALSDRLDESLTRARRKVVEMVPDVTFVRWWLNETNGEIVYQFRAPGCVHMMTWRESDPNTFYCPTEEHEQLEEFRFQSRRLH